MSTKPTNEALPNGWQWMTGAPPWWEDHRADKWVCGALFLSQNGEDDTVWVNYSTNAGGRVTVVDGDHAQAMLGVLTRHLQRPAWSVMDVDTSVARHVLNAAHR